MKQLHNLEIDEEFHKLCPKQTREVLDGMRASLKAEGCHDAIKVWGGVVVDGMTRYKLCHEEGVPFEVQKLSFADDDAARDWIIRNQLEYRRNLTESQASELRGRLYQERRKPVGAPKSNENATKKQKVQSEPVVSTAEQVAEETGVSPATVKRDAKYVEALDSVPEPIQEAARDGKLKKSQVQQIAEQPEFIQEVIAESIKAGEEPKEAVKQAYGKCPACACSKWKQTESGIVCAKCNHPYGEPAGEVDSDRIGTQRSKAVKTAEALLREIDSLHLLLPKKASNDSAISGTKAVLKILRGWK